MVLYRRRLQENGRLGAKGRDAIPAQKRCNLQSSPRILHYCAGRSPRKAAGSPFIIEVNVGKVFGAG